MGHLSSKIKHAVSAAVFLIIALICFVMLTNIYRTTKPNQRLNLVSLYNEKPHTLDMAIIGGSGVYRYFDPMYAYEESGMTSFVYACAALSGYFTEDCIKEVLHSQNPQLIVIDGRRWLSRCVENYGQNARYILDSIDWSVRRLQYVTRFCRTYGLSFSESVPYYFEMCLYHNNPDALLTDLNRQLFDNRYDNRPTFMKGFGMRTKVKPCKAPPAEITSSIKSTPLSPRTDAEFRKLMEFCSGLDADVLLMFTPYSINQGDMEEYNEMERIAAEYGIPSWNGNRYYDEIGLDFETDFYNSRHTNVSGAEKTTACFLSYLQEHYDFPDHRALNDRPEWDADLDLYHQHRAETWNGYKKRLKEVQEADA